MPKSVRSHVDQVRFRSAVDQVVGALAKAENTSLARTVVEFLTMSGDLTESDETDLIVEHDLED